MADPHETILQEAQRLVHGPRQQDYGHPLDDFTRTAAMWSAILGQPVTAEQVGLCMIAVKISRHCNHPKRDNLVDAAGYAATVAMVETERVTRNSVPGPANPSAAKDSCQAMIFGLNSRCGLPPVRGREYCVKHAG